MKKVIIVILLLKIAVACDDANAPDCLKSRGGTIVETIEVPSFSRIKINQEFVVYLEQSKEQSITISTGSNLLPAISFEVTDETLILSDNNSCNWVREYSFPVVYIRHPNIVEIRQNGGGKVISEGTLNFPQLTLKSEFSSGNFELSLNCTDLKIINNELSNYYLSGAVDKLAVGFFSGDSRFEGQNLVANSANVFHRGTNDIIVNVTESLIGRIISSGDIIYVGNVPSEIDVSIENKGELINKAN